MSTEADRSRCDIAGCVRGWLAAPLLLFMLAGCESYQGRLPLELQSFVDKSEAPLRVGGSSLGGRDDTPIDDATRTFVGEQLDSVRDGSQKQAVSTGDYPLSLAELRSTVLDSNLDLRVIEISPQIARERVNEERAKFDAVFTANASFRDEDKSLGNSTLFGVSSNDPAIAGATGVFTELAQDRDIFEGGVGIVAPLPTGARVGLRQSFEIDDKSALGLRSTEDRGALKFSLSQPLLRGAGVDVNIASIRLARLGAGSTAATTKLATIRVLAAAEKAYWRLYAAQRALDVRREQLRLATDNATLVIQLIDAGASAAYERFAAELAVAQQLEAAVIAQTSVRVQARELARVMNHPELPIDVPRPIDTTTDPVLVRYELDPDALVVQALAERLELLDLELKLAAEAIRVDLARNNVLPVFVVDFEFGLGDRSGSVSSAFADQFSFDNPSVGVGARASIPLTNDAAEARLRSAMLSRLQRLATKDQRSLAIRQEVYDTVDVMNQNWLRILAARQNVIAATGNFEAEQQIVGQGLGKAQDLLIALQQLGDARLREVNAIVSYQIAQVDLAFATGVLLGYAGTELDAE